jgi:hypothetical protein
MADAGNPAKTTLLPPMVPRHSHSIICGHDKWLIFLIKIFLSFRHAAATAVKTSDY